MPVVLARAGKMAIVATGAHKLSNESSSDLDVLVGEQQQQLRVAIAWLDAAVAEAHRRDEPPPIGAWYDRGRAMLALGRAERGIAALERAADLGDVERWHTDAALALGYLFVGDLERSLDHAHRAVRDCPASDGTAVASSYYVLALVLDRVGAGVEASTVLESIRRRFRSPSPAAEVEIMMPIHERVYLRALVQRAAGNPRNAARLWELYLARPEPEAPERHLVERHLESLRPGSVPVEPSSPSNDDEI